MRYPSNVGILATIATAGLAHAHIGAFGRGMYCRNGTVRGQVNWNNADPVQPLYNLTYEEYWMHHINKCDEFPPNDGEFLDLPAGGSFTVELAANLACTSLHPKAKVTPWGDCQNHPDNYSVTNLGGYRMTHSGGIPSPNLHTPNESWAAGTTFAISYQSDISKVTPNNSVVFTVRHFTPYKRVVSYDVPSGMPACPENGCHCIWSWVPRGYGRPDIYIMIFKCEVIPDGSSPKTIGHPKPPVWCEGNSSECVQGPKQVIIWNQKEGNNIQVDGYDSLGRHKSPGYNDDCGFKDGAQNDIFVSDTSSHSKRMVRRRQNRIH